MSAGLDVAQVLGLGLGLGVRHALDADHVVVVSSLLVKEPGVHRAARIAALWGLGHSATFLAVGMFVVVTGLRVSPRFDAAVEAAVCVMLVTVGVAQLVGLLGRPSRPVPRAASESRPVLFGMVHGLAGSAGIALVSLSTLRSPALAMAYLAVVAAGTVLGMVVSTGLLAGPLAAAGPRAEWLARLATGLLGLGLGLACAVRIVSAHL